MGLAVIMLSANRFPYPRKIEFAEFLFFVDLLIYWIQYKCASLMIAFSVTQAICGVLYDSFNLHFFPRFFILA